LTINFIKLTIRCFARVERKFFEKGIRRDRKPVPIHPKRWIDVNFLSPEFILEMVAPEIVSGW